MSESTSIVRSIGVVDAAARNYTVKWTARTRPASRVKPGTYTVFLESVREHGTYQIIRQEMTFTGKPQHFDFKPGSELGPVSFDYRKVGQ